MRTDCLQPGRKNMGTLTDRYSLWVGNELHRMRMIMTWYYCRCADSPASEALQRWYAAASKQRLISLFLVMNTVTDCYIPGRLWKHCSPCHAA